VFQKFALVSAREGTFQLWNSRLIRKQNESVLKITQYGFCRLATCLPLSPDEQEQSIRWIKDDPFATTFWTSMRRVCRYLYQQQYRSLAVNCVVDVARVWTRYTRWSCFLLFHATHLPQPRQQQSILNNLLEDNSSLQKQKRHVCRNSMIMLLGFPWWTAQTCLNKIHSLALLPSFSCDAFTATSTTTINLEEPAGR